MARCTTRLGSLGALAALATLGASIRPGWVHHQRLVRFPVVTTDRVRLRILATRAKPRLDRPGLFLLASPRD